MESLIGKVLDNYKIISILGKGGMGVVYKALDQNLDKVVALKMMDNVLSMDEAFISRFRSEAKALAKLENPNIVHIYALRNTEAGTFIVMEYVEGPTLDKMIKENGAIPWQKAITIFKQLLLALKHAHEANVIHRDIKPSNVLLAANDTVKLTDFGLAKITQLDGDATVTQFQAGSIHYMSPERIKDPNIVDVRIDIYALGMTYYEMLLGSKPFKKNESDFTVLKSIVEDNFPLPYELNKTIPKGLSKIISKSLEKNPNKRYQTANEMLNDLIRFEKENSIQKEVVTESKLKKTYTKMIASAVGITAIFIIIIVIISSIYSTNDANNIVIPNNKENNSEIEFIKYGKVGITSNPSSAKIYMNDKEIGLTPMLVDSLKEGIYDLRLEKKGFEKWYNSNVDVIMGEQKNVHAELEAVNVIYKGTITLSVVPNANIFIDNKNVASNTSDKVVKTLVTGDHKIEFVHPQFGRAEKYISIEKNQNSTLECYFYQWVNIQALDENEQILSASIIQNGQQKENMFTPREIILTPGTYKFNINKFGYEVIEEEVTINVSPVFKKIMHPIVFHLTKKK